MAEQPFLSSLQKAIAQTRANLKYAGDRDVTRRVAHLVVRISQSPSDQPALKFGKLHESIA
jgi:hypothetical protein